MTHPLPTHGTGYVPTRPDKLAKGLARYGQSLATVMQADRGTSVSLPVPLRLNQRWVNCCVGATYALGMAVLDAALPVQDRLGFSARSMLDIWARAKVLDGSRGNVGVTMDHGGDSVVVGAASADQLPLPASGRDDLLDPPTSGLSRVDNVLAHRLVNPQTLVDGCIAALQEGKPVAVGMGLDIVEYYRAGDQNGVVLKRGASPTFWHAELLTDYDADQGLFICTGSWEEWLGDYVTLASPRMDRTKVAFTLQSFQECIVEARVLDREPVPTPAPDPHTGHYTFRHQLWQPPQDGQWRISTLGESQVVLPTDADAWTATATVNPDGTLIYPSVFEQVVRAKGGS